MKEQKAQSKIRKYIRKRGYSEQDALELFNALRNDIPNIRLPFYKEQHGLYKFGIGVARMYLNGELSDANTILELNKTLKYVASDAHINEYDSNLNGLGVQELINRFKTVVSIDIEKDKEQLNSLTFNRNNEYNIVRVPDFETARKYSNYTSWCVTHNDGMYNNYTYDGFGLFYFILKNGFENIKREQGAGYPLDEYGLSMVAVSVNYDGSLNTCTCRWNHNNGGNDSIMNTKQISELIGANFYEVFKPYTREELHAKGKILFDEVQDLLNSGKKPHEIFDRCWNFKDGYAIVKLNYKWNFINTNGELLSTNQWFDNCYDFNNGYAKVELNDKYNWINTDGELLSPNQWFDNCGSFNNGYAKVELDGKWNLINTNGELVSLNQWFDRCCYFYDGYARVKLNNKYNFVNTNGELLSPNQWFDNCDDFNEGYARVELNGKWNYINTSGELLFPNQRFDWCDDFNEGYARVRLNNKYNFINTSGELLFPNQRFDDCDDFNEGYARVELNGKWNFINTNSEIVSPNQWFDNCYGINEGYARVELNNKWNWINTNGEVLFPNQWFDDCYNFNEGCAFVELDGKFNYINTNGELVSLNIE